MANLVNTFGVYQNFKKQPVKTEVGGYSGFQPASPPAGKADALINALDGINTAVNSKIKTEEDYRKNYGLYHAERLIKSTDEKDKLELDTRVLLQNAGMLDLKDNIYAMALLEKDVGKVMSNDFALRYKEKMVNNNEYKKSREEQLADFKAAREAYKASIDERRFFADKNSFDDGFNENYETDYNNVQSIHTKWFSAESAKEAKQAFQVSLFEYDIEKEVADGTYGTTMGELINKYRIMGVPENDIAQGLSKYFDVYLQNGGMDSNVANSLLDTNVGTWATNEKAGKPKTLKDWLGNPQPMYDALAANEKLWFTENTRNIFDKFTKASDDNPESVVAFYESLPKGVQKQYHSEYSHFYKRAQEVQQKKQQAAAAAAINSNIDGRINSRIGECVNNFISGKLTFNDGTILPKTLKDFRVPVYDEKTGKLKERHLDKDELAGWYFANAAQFAPSQQLDILNTPLFNNINDMVKEQAKNAFYSISPEILDNPQQRQNVIASLGGYAEMYKANPGKFFGVYGDDVGTQMAAYMALSEDASEDIALTRMAGFMKLQLGTDETTQLRRDILKQINETEDIELLSKDGSTDNINIKSNLYLNSRFTNLTEAFAGSGLSVDKAIMKAQNVIKKTMTVYNCGDSKVLIPNHIIDGTGLSQDALQLTLDTITENMDGNILFDWDYNKNQLEIRTWEGIPSRIRTADEFRNDIQYMQDNMNKASDIYYNLKKSDEKKYEYSELGTYGILGD